MIYVLLDKNVITRICNRLLNATYIEGLVELAYSISASAKAHLVLQDQYTGLKS